MPFPTRATFSGNLLHVYQDDGTVLTLIPGTENQWVNTKGSAVVEPPAGGASTGVTAAMVEAAVTSVGGSLGAMIDTSANIAAAFNAAIAATYPGILSSKNRAACLVGECAQETDWYKTTTEYSAGSNSYSPYDGRGYIQLTFQSNYAAFGRWMKSFGLLSDANYFVNNPARLSDLKWAPYTAIYYFTQPTWDNRNLFQWCDTSSTPWHDISRAINRGDPTSGSPAYGEADRTTAIDAVLAVTPDPEGPPTVTDPQNAVKTWMTDHLDAFAYTQDAQKRRDPITYGATDCSALIAYCYQTVLNKHTGWWTGTHDDGMQQYGSIVIPTQSGAINESLLNVGDLIFYNWDGPNVNFDHVDMYIGSNQVCGHGGPDPGPDIMTLSTRCLNAYNYRVRRYI